MAKVRVIPSTINPLTQMPIGEIRKRKVAAYSRVSTDSDEQYTSYESQCKKYTEYIINNPQWNFVEVYADEGISGTSRKNRVNFNRMIEDAKSGKIDLIVTTYYDGYWFLLPNSKNPLSNDLLNKFLFLLFGKTVDYSILLRITKEYFEYVDCPPFEAAVDFHLRAYDEMEEFKEIDRTAISLMLFNYSLVKNGVATISIFSYEYKEYFDLRQEYKNGNRVKLYDFLM